MALIPAKQYVQQRLAESKYELLFELIAQQHNRKKISDEVFHDASCEIALTYLNEVKSRCTTEAVKAAKKTMKTFIEAIINRDFKGGYIGGTIAYLSKELLPDFLKENA